jgi:hypothetical protein
MDNGSREWNSEVSIIDTGILLCGVLFAGEYFGDEVKEKAELFYRNINWSWYVDKKTKQFHLGYKNGRFYGHWDNYAEQLMLYVLAAASPAYPVNIYDYFKRQQKEGIIHSWFGCLFTYQYSHVWLDFRNTRDNDMVNWFDNSLRATIANREFCINNKTYKGYWGVSSTVSKTRYSQRMGASPASTCIRPDGTISLSALLSSVVFTPEYVKETIIKIYNNLPLSFGEYGFVASVNKKWVANEYLAIDKGTTMLMLANYYDELIWNVFMNIDHVKKGMDIIGIKKEH